jgi:hypothetical protein
MISDKTKTSYITYSLFGPPCTPTRRQYLERCDLTPGQQMRFPIANAIIYTSLFRNNCNSYKYCVWDCLDEWLYHRLAVTTNSFWMAYQPERVSLITANGVTIYMLMFARRLTRTLNPNLQVLVHEYWHGWLRLKESSNVWSLYLRFDQIMCSAFPY